MGNFIEQSAEEIMLRSMTNVFMPEALDPVGKEDDDIDNDGDVDKSDSYLKNRRKKVGAAIAAEKAKRTRKEELELHLRTKVGELTEKKLYKSEKATNSDEKEVTIEEKPVKNTVVINPDVNEGLINTVKNFVGLAKDKNHKVSDKTPMGAAVTGLQKRRQATDAALKMLRQGDNLEGDMTEATYPSDFVKGSGVAKKKYGRPLQHDQPMKGPVRKTVDEQNESDECETTLKDNIQDILERTRYAKEKGKDFKTGNESKKGGTRDGKSAFDKVSKEMRKTGGVMSSRGKAIQPQGKKKEKGKKGYKGVTPVDKIKNRLAQKRKPKKDPYSSRFD